MPASASSSEPLRPQAIVFDVDGTLIDTLPAVHSALNAVLGAAGRAPVDVGLVRQHFSAGMRGLLQAAWGGQDLDPQWDAALAKAYLERVTDLARPFPGVDGLLHGLSERGFRLGLCSNGSGEALQRMLSHFGWQQHFPAVVDAGNALALKPSPVPLQQVLNTLDTAPAQAWLVGDSELDGRCARAAGCQFVWVACGYGGAEAADLAHWHLDSPHQLTTLLRGD